jgi:signal transduction histidine kinase
VQGNGVGGMQERARALGGELRILAVASGGIRVEADLPTGGHP